MRASIKEKVEKLLDQINQINFKNEDEKNEAIELIKEQLENDFFMNEI